MVDDGSRDCTFSKLVYLKEKYGTDRIQVISLSTNQGPAAARNIGWEIASQKFIAFLDADEKWHPRKIAIQYTWMNRHPEIGLTGHSFMDGEEWEDSYDFDKKKLRFKAVNPLRLLFSNRFPTSSVMVKKDIPFRFKQSKLYSEDYHLWLKLVLNNFKTSYLDFPLMSVYKQRFGKGGLSAHLWKMEAEELKNYWQFYKQGHINLATTVFITFFSILKFIRRIVIIRHF